jgi:molybdenum cofactor cytidylyltransferase
MAQFLSVIVLAAGLSRRMGKENKLLLPFGETTILEATLSHILTAQLGEIFVVIGHEAVAVKAVLVTSTTLNTYRISELGCRNIEPEPSEPSARFETSPTVGIQKALPFTILTNNQYETGMTTSIQTGVQAAEEGSGGYMICLSDMPFITPAEYAFLKQQFLNILVVDKQAIIQPIFKGERGNPTILSSFYKNDILNLTYTEGCKPIVQANKKHVYLVEMPTNSVLRDIDFIEEYKKALG